MMMVMMIPVQRERGCESLTWIIQLKPHFMITEEKKKNDDAQWIMTKS